MTDTMMTSTFKVGRFSCELRFPPPYVAVECEWSPRLPKRGEVTNKQVAQYEQRRNQFIAQVAAVIGKPIAIVEWAQRCGSSPSRC
jgi:hypothetical protein